MPSFQTKVLMVLAVGGNYFGSSILTILVVSILNNCSFKLCMLHEPVVSFDHMC